MSSRSRCIYTIGAGERWRFGLVEHVGGWEDRFAGSFRLPFFMRLVARRVLSLRLHFSGKSYEEVAEE